MMRAVVPEENKELRETVPGLSERRKVHVLNPAAGKKKHFEIARRTIGEIGGEILTSERPGQIEELVRELFIRDPYAHAIVYGGDGTIYETVNGMMNSGASDTASFSVIPGGSGNDFSAYANESGRFVKTELYRIDLTKTICDGVVRYCANMMNIGFDCDVVRETYRLKKLPLLGGKATYFTGVFTTFAKKKTFPAKILMENRMNFSGNPLPNLEIDQDLLICACANSKIYGGGFKAAPLALLDDGAMDVITINDVTRREFITLVGDYNKGTYVLKDGTLKPKFENLVTYNRCSKITITGPRHFCLDGEIFEIAEGSSVSAETVKKAIWFSAI